MSNQVARNGQGSQNNYSPNKAAFDRLTLAKNQVKVAPLTSFGVQAKGVSGAGAGLFLDRLNGTNVLVGGGVGNYSPYQNAATRPYYLISANSAIFGGATLIYSKTDNVLSIDVCIPCGLVNTVVDDGKDHFSIGIKVYNADGSLYATYVSEEHISPLAQPGLESRDGVICALNSVVRVGAGQFLAVYAAINPLLAATTAVFFYKDMLYLTSTGDAMQVECCVDIQKL